MKPKTTDMLIKELHKYADALSRPNTPINTEEIVTLMNDVADRLFELEERIAIILEPPSDSGIPF